LILTETLKCSIPSPNAVKDAVIYCVTSPTNNTELWSLLVSGIAAVGTVGAVAVAVYLGIRSSKEVERSDERLREFERERDWMRQFSSYSTALIHLTRTFPNHLEQTTFSYYQEHAIYRSFSHRYKNPISVIVHDFHLVLGDILLAHSPAREENEAPLIRSQWDRRLEIVSDELGPLALEWIELLSRWHNELDSRSDIEKQLLRTIEKLNLLLNKPKRYLKTEYAD
jgi:hypothetical protein